MNKHLIKIILEYISLTPIYNNELLNKTNKLSEEINLENWNYYDNYIICKEDCKYIYKRNDKIYIKFVIFHHEDDFWNICMEDRL